MSLGMFALEYPCLTVYLFFLVDVQVEMVQNSSNDFWEFRVEDVFLVHFFWLFFIYLSGVRWSDILNMKNKKGQLMRFGAKFRKNYPWSNWWLTARKGCLQRNLIALVYVQTRLPLEPYSTYLTIRSALASHEPELSFDGTFCGDEKIKKLIVVNVVSYFS